MSEPESWYTLPGPESDIVLSSRARLARNIIGYNFPCTLSAPQEAEVQAKIKAAFQSLGHDLGQFEIVQLDAISPLERKILLERNVVSQEFSVAPKKMIVVSADESFSGMINEEDHLRLACIQSGLSLEEVYQRVDDLDTELEKALHFTASLEFGYLSSSLENAGTGLRVSVMLHLAALVMDGDIGWALKTAGQLELQIKGYWGEGDNSLGNMYQISNQICLGSSEREIVQIVREGVTQVIQFERKARDELLNSRITELEDLIYRAYGILSHCRVISSQEAIKLLSTLRFGISLDILEGISLEKVTELLIHSQKAHVQKKLEALDDDTDNKLVDYTRAKMIRTAIGGSQCLKA